MITPLRVVVAFFALLYFSGCSAEEFSAVTTAIGKAANDGLAVKDRYEHPESYRPHINYVQ